MEYIKASVRPDWDNVPISSKKKKITFQIEDDTKK